MRLTALLAGVAGAFACICVALAVVGADAYGRISFALAKARLASNIEVQVAQLVLLTTEVARHPTERGRYQWYLQHDRVGELLKGEANAQRMPALREEHKRLGALFERLPKSATDSSRLRIMTLGGRVDAAAQKMVLDAFALAENAQNDTRAAFESVARSAGTVLGLLGLLVLLSAWLIRQRVLLPVRALETGARAFSAGQLGHRLEPTFSDEIGLASHAMNVMADNLRVEQERLSERNRELTAEIGQRKHTERELAEHNAALQRLSHQLKLANQELEQFTSVASHDLKAPLRAISNLTDWLEEDLESVDGELAASMRHNLNRLRTRTHRMEGLIQGLLDYARASVSGDVSEPVDVDGLINNIIDDFDTPPGLQIRTNGCAGTVTLPKAAVETVLRNLVGNAITHHDQNEGFIDVTMTAEPEQYVFTIEDDGPGIPAQARSRVFTMFERLEQAAQRHSSGMGLTIVKRVVESHGGQITICDSSHARGARFEVSWPRCSPPGAVAT